MIWAILFFFVAFGVCLLSTPAVMYLARSSGVGLDGVGDPRKRHHGPKARLGGVPLMLGLAVAIGGMYQVSPKAGMDWFPLIVGSIFMFGLGLWDDVHPLGARKKFLGQILIALVVYALGLSIDRVSYPRGAWSVELGSWSLPITIFWLIAVPNIVNLIDGFDGLAGGLGLVMALTLGIVTIFAEQVQLAWYAFALAGALLGFLWFNFPPAKIFLGDGGAYLVGFSIAGLSLTGSHKGSIAAVMLVTVVGLGVPILDTLLAMGRRALRGFPVFHADDEHIHHQLEDLGFSKRRIVLGLYAVCVALSVIGLSIIWSQGRTIPIAVGTVFLLAVLALRYLNYIKSWGDIGVRLKALVIHRQWVRYALLQAQVMDMEIDRCNRADEFWDVFGETLKRVGFVGEGGPPGDDLVEIRYDGSEPWALTAPRSGGSEKDWRRVANCFRPIYMKAIKKWGR